MLSLSSSQLILFYYIYNNYVYVGIKAIMFLFWEKKEDKSGCIVVDGFERIKQVQSTGMH